MRINFRLTALGLFLGLVTSTHAAKLTANYVDVHMHLNGRMPGPMGQGGGFDFAAAAEGLIQKMDELGVAKALIMPPPQAPAQKGGYTHQPMLSAIKKYPRRLYLMAGGGELNPMIVATAPGAVTESVKTDFKNKAQQILSDGAKGFGEMTALHFCFAQKHHFEQTNPDHPLFLLLADIAAQNNVPIDLHMEVVPNDQPISSQLADRCAENPAVVKANVGGFERLLTHNRGARIVWQHVGWDNTGHKSVAFLRQMLTNHPNLFMALKYVRPEREPFNVGNEMFDSGMKLRLEWLQLFKDFPDRFVIGADEFVGPANQPRRAGPPSFADTWSLMGQLPENLRAKIGSENAIRIYQL